MQTQACRRGRSYKYYTREDTAASTLRFGLLRFEAPSNSSMPSSAEQLRFAPPGSQEKEVGIRRKRWERARERERGREKRGRNEQRRNNEIEDYRMSCVQTSRQTRILSTWRANVYNTLANGQCGVICDGAARRGERSTQHRVSRGSARDQ